MAPLSEGLSQQKRIAVHFVVLVLACAHETQFLEDSQRRRVPSSDGRREVPVSKRSCPIDDRAGRLGRVPVIPEHSQELERKLGLLRAANAVLNESAIPEISLNTFEPHYEQTGRRHLLVVS